jgi:hypothetical protein
MKRRFTFVDLERCCAAVKRMRERHLGRHYTPTGMYTYSRPGTVAMVEFNGGAYRLPFG